MKNKTTQRLCTKQVANMVKIVLAGARLQVQIKGASKNIEEYSVGGLYYIDFWGKTLEETAFNFMSMQEAACRLIQSSVLYHTCKHSCSPREGSTVHTRYSPLGVSPTEHSRTYFFQENTDIPWTEKCSAEFKQHCESSIVPSSGSQILCRLFSL